MLHSVDLLVHIFYSVEYKLFHLWDTYWAYFHLSYRLQWLSVLHVNSYHNTVLLKAFIQ